MAVGGKVPAMAGLDCSRVIMSPHCDHFLFLSMPLLFNLQSLLDKTWVMLWYVLLSQRTYEGGECRGMGKRQGVWVWEWRGMKGWVVWWLDGVDVSVMTWCQTLCHCQCQLHQLILQWSATVQCVSKPLCCCMFHQLHGVAVVLFHCFFSSSITTLTLPSNSYINLEDCTCKRQAYSSEAFDHMMKKGCSVHANFTIWKRKQFLFTTQFVFFHNFATTQERFEHFFQQCLRLSFSFLFILISENIKQKQRHNWT